MRIISMLSAAMLLWTATFYAADDLSFKVRIPTMEQASKPEIRKDDGRIRTEKQLPDRKTVQPKAGSLAERVGESGKEIFWTPAWEEHGSGSVRLKSVSVSRDASLLLCVEETGISGQGPFGALLLLIDPAGQRILHYYELSRKVVGISADLQGTKAVCYAENQPVMKQPAGFLVLDLKNGKELAFRPEAKEISSYLLCRNRLIVSYADGSLTSTDLNSGEKKTAKPGASAKLELTADGRTLIAASGKAVHFYEPEQLKLQKTVALPEEISVYRVIPGDAKGSVFLSTTPGFGKSRVFLIYDKSCKLVTDDSSGEIACDFTGKMLVSGRFLKNRLYKIDPVSFSDLSYCDPKNLRPVTGGSTRFIFRGQEDGEVIVVDTRSAVYSLKSVGRRWTKKLIVESGTKHP